MITAIKPKFVLVDHSIVDNSGHHLEYARRVIAAASSSGFFTILAVNKSACNIECPGADLVLKIFSKTFWEIQRKSKLRRFIGFIFNLKKYSIQQSSAEDFSNELRLLIKQGQITEIDYIFIPNLGGSELFGISMCSSFYAALNLRWHLLFRRGITTPSGFFDFRNMLVDWEIRSSFALASSEFVNGSRHFYTDTQELSSQYRAIAGANFKTLPIPIDENLGLKPLKGNDPFVVSYVGDMRDEKGIHLLPQLIESMRQDGFGADKLVFRIQANVSVGGASKKTTRARKALLRKVIDGVEIIDGPLNSAAYHDLILSSDIIILPYSKVMYSVRSSGVFAEAVAAGVPTIHPSDTWMGRNSLVWSKEGYSESTKLSCELKTILRDYSRYEITSAKATKQWRNFHSAVRLVQTIIEN
jgi:glycosyltransferase involved in cell wall biosynthesis